MSSTAVEQRSWKTTKWQNVSFYTPLGVSYMMYATLTFSWKLSWRLPWHRTKTWFYTECGLALSGTPTFKPFQGGHPEKKTYTRRDKYNLSLLCTHKRTHAHAHTAAWFSLSLSWQSSTWTVGWKKTTFLFAESLAWHILIIRRYFSLHVLKSPVLGSAGSLYKAIYCIKCTHKHTHTYTHIQCLLWRLFEMFDILGGAFQSIRPSASYLILLLFLLSVLALGPNAILGVYSCLNLGPKQVDCNMYRFSKRLLFFLL